MVPSTPGSGLAKGVRELLQAVPGPLGTSTKVLEHPGANIHQGLAPNNPFKRTHCHRNECPYFVSGRECRERCQNVGLVYRAICTRCEKDQEREGVPEEDRVLNMYLGESSRTLYTRSHEHIGDYLKAAIDRAVPGTNDDSVPKCRSGLQGHLY